MKQIICLILLWCLTSGAQAVTEVVIAADRWCPYNCEPGTVQPGYMVEITRRAFELQGEGEYRVIYKVLPWSRAILYAQKGKIGGIIGATAEEAEGLKLTKNALGVSRSFFFSASDAQWRYQNIEQLVKENVRIGVINDYDYGEEIGRFIERNRRLVTIRSGEDPLPDLIRLVGLKKLDAVVEDEFVFRYALQRLGRKREDFKNVGAAGPKISLYVAFNNEAYVDILEQGIETLRSTGELKKILHKYNLEDWEPSRLK